MTVVRIDARRLTDEAGLHAALAEAFGFPPTYGRNLDALVDCLTHLGETALALGDRAGARSAWQEALDLLRHLRVPQVAQIEDRLTSLDRTAAAELLRRRSVA